jgi:cyanophycinase
VLSATSDTAEESAIYGERYAAIFKKLAPDAAVGFVGYVTPENDAAAAKQVRRANIVFMIGGDQDYLAQQYHPKTETYQSLKTKLQMDGGFVLAGTSAGAAIVSHHMISGGKPEEPQKVLERMGTGFGFLPGVIVDTHFFARHRLPRELTVIGDRYPGHLGMGLEEATGLIVRRGTLAEVVGAGKVWLISKDLNPELKEDRLYPLTEPSVAAYANKGLRVHYMEKGDVYDLARHKLLTQEQVAQRTEEINGAPALAAGGGGR